MDTYEKKYKEALERAKEQLEGAKVFDYKEEQIAHDIRTVTYAIFPELKESEDERIRKTLIRFFKDSYHNETEMYGVTVGKALAWLEKQGEQKNRKASYTAIAETGNGGINALITRELPTDDCDDEQKPAEWSEEDINMIDWLIRCCEEEHKELCNDKYGHQDIVSDLKMDCRKKWDWLESLKNRVAPQNTWKPSDEQIRFLQAMVNDPNNASSESCQIVLKDILEKLKKLKEEKV